MISSKKYFALSFLLFTAITQINAQTYWDNITKRPSTLGLDKGYVTVETPAFNLKLVEASQTVAQLSPKTNPDFDFTPGDRITIRDKDSTYQLGDLNLRIKQADGSWKSYSSAWHRAAVKSVKTDGKSLAAADLSPTFPEDLPLIITRYYEVDGDNLVMRFKLKNKSTAAVEVGALGIPMVFNNILEGKSLDDTHAQNVFFDPYIGEDAGYLEVKRLSGHGPVLLVLPEENMPFEAYRPLLDDPTRRSIVFEGYHEWMPLSKAYADTEWKGVTEWNTPSALILKPGEEKNFALKFVLTDKIENIQQKLIEEKRPVAVGVPGYVLPEDVHADLFLKYDSAVTSLKVEPEGALEIQKAEKTQSGYFHYKVQGKKWGRARLALNYKDGLKQTINYKVIKPEAEVVKDFGHFVTTAQWFDDPNDPFHRNPSA
ncbi:MAG: DUF5695 domain-containing protein, partial [Leeuwenhoekiella sp.]